MPKSRGEGKEGNFPRPFFAPTWKDDVGPGHVQDQLSSWLTVIDSDLDEIERLKQGGKKNKQFLENKVRSLESSLRVAHPTMTELLKENETLQTRFSQYAEQILSYLRQLK